VAEPQYPDLVFPLAGVDKQGEFGQQRAGTTPTGQNVRSLDPRTRRRRGATRAGLSKFAPLQVDGTSTLIQHLNVIVDPTTEALLVRFVDDYGIPGGDNNNPDYVMDDSTNNEGPNPDDPDFRNPGRPIPDGGSGVDLSPDQPPTEEPGDGESGWRFVQKKSGFFEGGFAAGRTDQVTFDTETLRHQMIVVVLLGGGDSDGTNDYEVARYESYVVPGEEGDGANIAYVAWCRNETGGACTVSVTQTATTPSSPFVVASVVVALEYRGLETSTPADGAEGAGGLQDNDGSNPTGTMSPGAVPITGQTRLVLGLFRGKFLSPYPTWTPAGGWTVRYNETAVIAGGVDWQFAVLEKLSSGVAEEPTVDYDHSAFPFNGWAWVAAGAGWRYR
jgi:hypothetical protein